MSTLTRLSEEAAEAVARDARSSDAEGSTALLLDAIDEFLTTPPITTLRAADPAVRAGIIPKIADQIRVVIERLRDMLSVAMQSEHHGVSIPWIPHLAESLRHIEAEFSDVPNLMRQSPPPVVRTSGGAPWVDTSGQGLSAPTEPSGEESLGDILEDAMDLVRAQHTEAMALVRKEVPLDWDSVRRDLDRD